VVVGAADPAVFRAGLDSITENVVVAGHLEDSELVGLFRGTTALLFPSLYEGFGIPPLEGMAIGCPVVASRIPAVVEVCGDAALYFDPHDKQGLMKAMLAVARDPQVRDSLLARGGKRAQLYSWHSSARKLLDAIKAVT
jgi:glycosyltransferase involved in cell wall biosynthesis